MTSSDTKYTLEEINRWYYLNNDIILFLIRSGATTRQEVIDFLREEKLVERPQKALIPYIDQLLENFRSRKKKKQNLEISETESPIGSNPFMEDFSEDQ